MNFKVRNGGGGKAVLIDVNETRFILTNDQAEELIDNLQITIKVNKLMLSGISYLKAIKEVYDGLTN